MPESDTEPAMEVLHGVWPEPPAVCSYGGCPKIGLRRALLQGFAKCALNLKIWCIGKNDENFVTSNVYTNTGGKYLFIQPGKFQTVVN